MSQSYVDSELFHRCLLLLRFPSLLSVSLGLSCSLPYVSFVKYYSVTATSNEGAKTNVCLPVWCVVVRCVQKPNRSLDEIHSASKHDEIDSSDQSVL